MSDFVLVRKVYLSRFRNELLLKNFFFFFFITTYKINLIQQKTPSGVRLAKRERDGENPRKRNGEHHNLTRRLIVFTSENYPLLSCSVAYLNKLQVTLTKRQKTEKMLVNYLHSYVKIFLFFFFYLK